MLKTYDYSSRWLFTCFGVIIILITLINLHSLSVIDVRSRLRNLYIPISGRGKWTELGLRPDPYPYDDFDKYSKVNDHHPIAKSMQEADLSWLKYNENRSTTFFETITKYRKTYGRHPPPGFPDWYRFARDRNVHHLDDFKQIMDDLRPFWAIKPSTIRLQAAHLHQNPDHGISGLHIRQNKVWKLTNVDWRMEIFSKMVKPFVKFLPDMDVAMNRLDQPRMVVPWDDMQSLLAKENESKRLHEKVEDKWTKNLVGLFNGNDEEHPSAVDLGFFPAHGQQYMNIARESCPPESPARNSSFHPKDIEKLYKDAESGLVTNFNLSSDLCTVGPVLENKHGFLFAPSTIWATRKLLPIFGESKTSVNSDILFPANMYYSNDKRYAYDPTYDYDWDDKKDCLLWRGVTSGGTNTVDNWQNMHRQRLVAVANATLVADKKSRILKYNMNLNGAYYRPWSHFNPSNWLINHTDVGFTEPIACVPNCEFYKDLLSFKEQMTLSQQFKYKYLVDVDGHSFSGRWHAFLRSKSLPIKSTIFREWHDSRLFAWKHFVPLDNLYDDLYSILTYFIGLGSPISAKRGVPYVQRHNFEGRKIGLQGREWAAKVLRQEDIEVYLFRLLLEYGRLIDDNRDLIGYTGDGSELAEFDSKYARTA
ncbi:putative capsule-associated protein cap1 [Erysiphe necator]|uniref:Putative capsule-associated protein cap1 n=1 Tax=Uncinula necator TaxID=52586 RepID=A0A0B1NWM1_UNCNE|nr:putative capsule-associated protein cap1 [Erysiphe necator]